MKIVLAASVYLLLTVSRMNARADDQPKNVLANAHFEAGLHGWSTTGEVAVIPPSEPRGKAAVRIGPGAGELRQRVAVGGLKIVWFGANLRPDTVGVRGAVRVQCLDAHGRLVMDLRQPAEAEKPDGKGSSPGIYLKTQAHTAAIVVSIEKASAGAGCLYADSPQLYDYDLGRVEHRPECDLDRYTQPFWTGGTVLNETVLMFSEHGRPASGRLMYTPRRILSIRDYSLGMMYTAGKDFTVTGNAIICTPSTRMPFMRDWDFDPGDLKWFTLAGKHVVVTYTHDDTWRGPLPAYQGTVLAGTMRRLKRRAPLTVVAYGDSITLGAGTSSEIGMPPYMPPYPSLFVHRLKQIYGDDAIRLYNTSLGGMTSSWGRENAASAVASLDPDLVLIAFGMNDFWSTPPEHFRENIRSIISQIRAKRPSCEFVLVAATQFDPAYAHDAQYRERLASYVPVLHSLAGKGIECLDMDAISRALFVMKKPKDVLNDPLHPNDFLARWYAQGLAALLDNGSGPVERADEAPAQVHSDPLDRRHSPKKGLGIYPEIAQFHPASELGLSWYYDWSLDPTPGVSHDVEFVPMVFGWYGNKEGKESGAIAAVKTTSARYLLGYNEPDGSDQSSLTPTQALAAWPLLMQTGLPLGSPAAVHADEAWMRAFMAGAAAGHDRVDFITVHWYYLTDAKSFLAYLERVHRLYGLPIWVTEFANVDWDQKPGTPCKFTPHDVANFLRVVLPQLNKLDWVQRYAWFESATGPYATATLFNDDGTLTEAGRVYAAD